MIRNDRQLGVTRQKRDASLAAAEAADAADRRIHEEFARELTREIDEYLGLRNGYVSSFPVESVDQLADALIKARISRGWTQDRLAQALGVSEQMVQKDEA